MKFTPGPWFVDDAGNGVFHGKESTPDNWVVFFPDIESADAKLIAAAPAMYEALVNISIAFREGGSHLERTVALIEGEKAFRSAQ